MSIALIASALAMALAFAPRAALLSTLVVLVVTSAAVSFVPIASGWTDAVFLGCWISVAACAVMVHLPRGIGARAAIALSLNAGIWSGAVIALEGSRRDLLVSLPIAVVFLFAASFTRRRLPIAVKVVASWLIAVAILAATLQTLSVTPGYLPDHME